MEIFEQVAATLIVAFFIGYVFQLWRLDKDERHDAAERDPKEKQ